MNPFACVPMPFTKQLDLDILPFPLLSPFSRLLFFRAICFPSLTCPLLLFLFIFLSCFLSFRPFSSPRLLSFHLLFPLIWLGFILFSSFFSSVVSSHLTYPPLLLFHSSLFSSFLLLLFSFIFSTIPIPSLFPTWSLSSPLSLLYLFPFTLLSSSICLPSSLFISLLPPSSSSSLSCSVMSINWAGSDHSRQWDK